MNLLVVLDAERGALARLLLVVERRGFRVVRLIATPLDQPQLALLVHLEVESSRDLGLLERMLERLEDVRSVTAAGSLALRRLG